MLLWYLLFAGNCKNYMMTSFKGDDDIISCLVGMLGLCELSWKSASTSKTEWKSSWKMQLTLYQSNITSSLVLSVISLTLVFWHDTTVNETSISLLVLAFLFLRQADFPSFDWGSAGLGSLPLSSRVRTELPGEAAVMHSHTVEPLSVPLYCIRVLKDFLQFLICSLVWVQELEQTEFPIFSGNFL